MAVTQHHAYLAAEPVVATAADSPELSLAWLLFALPLAGAAILLLGGRRTDSWGHWLATALPLGSFALAVFVLADLLGRARSSTTGPTTLDSAESEAPPARGVWRARTSSGTFDWYLGSRAASTGLRDSCETVPSGSSAGMSIALCRA